MKRILYILLGLAVLAIAACEKIDDRLHTEDTVILEIDPAIVGEWMLTEMRSENHIIEDIPSIYLCIHSDCTFELYQKSGTQSVRYDKYSGTCHTSDGMLKGTYSNGEEWASSWEYSFSLNKMILSSFNLLEVNAYEKVEIPEDVRTNANEVSVKSRNAVGAPIL